MAIHQPHVVIVGGAYGGLSALNSLISLSNGKGHPEGKKRPGPPGGRGGGGGGAGRGGGESGRGGREGGGPPGGGPPGPPPGPPGVERALHTKPRYTLLDERDGFYHTVGAPLGQISAPHAREFWIKYDEILETKVGENVEFVHGSAARLDTDAKTLGYTPSGEEGTRELKYDYLVVASGMSRGWPIVPKSLDYESYVRDAEGHEKELSGYEKIVLVGGGACGIEFSAELKSHFPEKEVILIHSRADLLSREPLTDEFKAIALKLVKEQGVQVLLDTRLLNDTVEGSKHILTLSTGDSLTCDKVIYTAVQQGANTEFIPKSALDPQGCVNVRDTFQFPTVLPNADAHYAIGDAAVWTGIKRSGPAQSMGKYAATNIITSMLAAEDGKVPVLAACPASKPTMTLAVGEQAIGMRMGLRYGKQVKMGAFGTGLGIDGTLASLGLRPRKSEEVGNATGVLEDPKVGEGRAVVANI